MQNVARFLNSVLFNSISLAIQTAFFLICMFTVHVKLTLACLATIPLLGACTVIFSRLIRKNYRSSRREQNDLVLTLAENLQGVHMHKDLPARTWKSPRSQKSTTE